MLGGSCARSLAKGRRALARQLIDYLPQRVRRSLGRDLIAVPVDGIPGVVVKLATTKAELEGAFRLVYAAYLAAGFTERRPSQMRVTKYHLLPTTSTIVAVAGKAVVATVTLIQDGGFGLPIDAVADLAGLRTKGRIVEISGLAVDPRYRYKGAMLCLLTKFMVNYSLQCQKPDYWVAAANPAHSYLYESVWNFSRLSAHVADSYAFAAGAPAVCWYADLSTWALELAGAYGERPSSRNLASFYFRRQLESLELPDRPLRLMMDPVMTPDLLKYFFVDQSDVIASLSAAAAALLCDIYRSAAFQDVLAPRTAAQGEPKRLHSRFPVRCPARAMVAGGTGAAAVALDVKDVSRGGFGAVCGVPLSIGQTLRVTVALGEFDVVNVRVRVMWGGAGGRYGLRVEGEAGAWLRTVGAMTPAYESLGGGLASRGRPRGSGVAA